MTLQGDAILENELCVSSVSSFLIIFVFLGYLRKLCLASTCLGIQARLDMIPCRLAWVTLKLKSHGNRGIEGAIIYIRYK